MAKIVEHAARNNFGQYAVGAGRAEREGQWLKAALLWRNAHASARDGACREWAEIRIAFCEKAKSRGWRGSHECQGV
ncbi:Uncharacterised protein [Cedecea neteri]|uniref:ANR family transcriptional regulator n=1 Tax=Cedecea neteri TaxID=158822 RepID=A0A291DYQ2_9ENTR|nr:ANR family transcriptional regulator [Cedecea neteri]ATF92812.1 hypothetical protein CO704_12245 [Cedecea neteri]SQC93446.1 Uncharacterised protein [Cedecea neteri]